MLQATVRAGVYLRVSTATQTTDNQRMQLTAAALQRGWQVVEFYEDHGISGAKGRDHRPGLNHMLKDATRGRINIVMAWSIDRLGRSLSHLVSMLQELDASHCALYLHQQAIDTTTPGGRALFGMLGVFAEFEREMIRERILAGLERTKAKGTILGRRPVNKQTEEAIKNCLMKGCGIRETSRFCFVSTSVVQRVKRAITHKPN